MEGLEKLLHSRLEEKMSDGSFKKILDEYIDSSVRSTLEDLFKHDRWDKEKNGEGYKYIDKTISPLVMRALEESDLEKVAENTKVAMNELINQCSVAQTGKAIGRFLGLFDENEGRQIKIMSDYSLENIFEKYKDFVQSMIDREWLEENNVELDEDGRAWVGVTCKIEDLQTKTSWMSVDDLKLVKFMVNDTEENDFFEQMFLAKDYKGRWCISLTKNQFGLDDIKNLTKFNMLIYYLNSRCVYITDLSCIDEDIYV